MLESMIYLEEKYRQLLDQYVQSGTPYATSLVAIIFGQFSVLTLLQSKGCPLISTMKIIWPVWILIGIYGLIVSGGSYIGYNYLMFARFLEYMKSSCFLNLKTLDYEMRRKVGGSKCLQNLREGLILKKWSAVGGAVAYACFSILALVATLCM
jgi:hypothetical protein